MNKELSDLVWRILPAEFREGVKKLYTDALDASNSPHDPDDRKWGNYRVTLLEKLFGEHNLTSDAKGEDDEMLYVSRKRVQEIFTECNDDAIQNKLAGYPDYALWEQMKCDLLKHLFGSKCLPDESVTDCHKSQEPKPAEPKFKAGDIVRYRYDRNLYIVECKTGKYHYALRQYDCDIMMRDVLESDLEPYTEPQPATERSNLNKESSTCTDDCSCGQPFRGKQRNG